MAKEKSTKVLIVGAGPVGLLTAVMLAKCGIDVDVLESATQIDQRPRGIAYGPPAVKYTFSPLPLRHQNHRANIRVPECYVVRELSKRLLRWEWKVKDCCGESLEVNMYVSSLPTDR